MITNAHYGVEPWVLTEDHLDLDVLAQSESVFALSNGHIGLRGNLDEGEPFGLPGTYLNSLYEERPLPYAEAGYGFPQVGQTVINVTNGKVIRLLVNDEPFDIRYGTVHSHVRTLDLRAGTLTRNVDWTSPAGNRVRITSVRLVSLTQRAVAAVRYTVTPVGETLRLVVMSEIVANEDIPVPSADPRDVARTRSAATGRAGDVPLELRTEGPVALWSHSTVPVLATAALVAPERMIARVRAAGLQVPDMQVVVTPHRPVACAGPGIAARLAGESTESSVTLPWTGLTDLPWI